MNTPNGHVLRYSDEKGSRKLHHPCPKPVGKGGLTFEEWRTEKRRSRT